MFFSFLAAADPAASTATTISINNRIIPSLHPGPGTIPFDRRESELTYKFKNADRLKRNRRIEGEEGTEIGFPGGDKLWILAATDANPRWVRFGDDYINGLRRLTRANASDDRVKAYQVEWFTNLFVLRWDVKGDDDEPVPFSKEAVKAYLEETDDVVPAIQRTAFDTMNFRGDKVEVTVREGKD